MLDLDAGPWQPYDESNWNDSLPHGAVPLAMSYDIHEQVWNPPMPLLFQRKVGVENRPSPAGGVRALLNNALARTGLTDAGGAPLLFSPHDFRRLFITDAILNGMPPHIAQLVVGHRDITTTMGYKAVYPEEVINGHRAFIARRRATRPSEEYRTPTDTEWEEFLGNAAASPWATAGGPTAPTAPTSTAACGAASFDPIQPSGGGSPRSARAYWPASPRPS